MLIPNQIVTPSLPSPLNHASQVWPVVISPVSVLRASSQLQIQKRAGAPHHHANSTPTRRPFPLPRTRASLLASSGRIRNRTGNPCPGSLPRRRFLARRTGRPHPRPHRFSSRSGLEGRGSGERGRRMEVRGDVRDRHRRNRVRRDRQKRRVTRPSLMANRTAVGPVSVAWWRMQRKKRAGRWSSEA